MQVTIEYNEFERFKYYCKNNHILITNVEYSKLISCKIELEDDKKEKVDNILKEESTPYIFRFSSLYKDELQIEVLSFDKEGNFIDSDIYVDYLESSDGINYKVVRQIHNELEDINNLHRRGK